MLLAILVISIEMGHGFGRSPKRKTSDTTNPIPFWRRWQPSDPVLAT